MSLDDERLDRPRRQQQPFHHPVGQLAPEQRADDRAPGEVGGSSGRLLGSGTISSDLPMGTSPRIRTSAGSMA